MRRILLYSAAIVAALSSCSSDDEYAGVGDKFAGNVVLSAEGYEFEGGTRTSLTNTGSAISFAWQNGEAIGVFPIAPTTNYQAKQIITTDADGLNAEFNGAGWALLKGNTYAAYSPCNESLPSNTPYTAVPVTMTGQKQTGNASLKHIGDAYDYMYAKADIPSNGGVVGFSFQHVGAIAMLQLTMPEDASWKSAALTSESSVFISSCTMNVSNGSLANKTTSKSQTLELASVSGKDITLYMAMLPCTTGELTLTVTSSTDKEYTAKLVSKTLVAGKAYKWEASPKGATINYGEAPANAQAVDLGLPSGLKWANMNIGATKVSDYGNYYAWGETEPQSSNTYDWSSYKWCSNGSWTGMTKYTYKDGEKSGIWYSNGSFIGDGETTLALEDDAAHVNWGGDWRMPTHAEQEELVNNTTSTWTSNYNGTGVAGRILTSKVNDNSIFLPASGYRWAGSLYSDGSYGYYWSSSLGGDYSSLAWYLYFNSGGINSGYYSSRNDGHAVRAVCQ